MQWEVFKLLVSLREDVRKSRLTPPRFIKVSVPSEESVRSCSKELEASLLPISTIFLLDFGNISRVWHFIAFHFIQLSWAKFR